MDEIPGAHYYNIALMLPDVSKKWIKKFDPSKLPESASVIQQDLLKGTLKHYESDKRFHTSSFFEKYQHLINEKLKTLPFSDDVNRKWFIAHVVTELLVDRQIVKWDVACVNRFYDSWAAIDDRELSLFLTYFGMVDTREFITFMNHFRNARYIYYYADNNKFLYSLGRIMMRVGIKEMSEADGLILIKAILDIEHEYMTDAALLLGELKAVFK